MILIEGTAANLAGRWLLHRPPPTAIFSHFTMLICHLSDLFPLVFSVYLNFNPSTQLMYFDAHSGCIVLGNKKGSYCPFLGSQLA